MRQTLHIFRKDARFLWPQILAALALAALFGWCYSVDPWRFGGFGRAQSARGMIAFLVALSWVYLASAAIHKELPAGDRQFWVTRPYRWKSLLAAKALLLFAFINIPLFLADAAILAAHGLAPSAAQSLLRQALVTLGLLLPAMALAAVTRDQAQAAGAIIGAAVSLALVSAYTPQDSGWGPLAGMHACIVVAVLSAGALGVLLWQYARRRTMAARAVLGAVVGLCLAIVAAPPNGAAIALYGPEPEVVRPVHLCVGLASCDLPTTEPHRVTGWYPIRVEGLPAGMRADPLLVDVTITGSNGASWRSGWIGQTVAFPFLYWGRLDSDGLELTLGARVTDQFQSQPVKISVSLAMTIYRTEATASLIPGQPPQAIAGVGACSVDSVEGFGRPLLSCSTTGYPLPRLEADGTMVFPEQYDDTAMFEPSPVLEPATLWDSKPGDMSPIRLTAERPVAHIRRDLVIERMRFLNARVQP